MIGRRPISSAGRDSWELQLASPHLGVNELPPILGQYEIIPIGGRVLAAGWIETGPDGGWQLVAKGTTPALLVATGPHGDPRTWLERLRRTRSTTAVQGVVLGALGVALWLTA